jgi:phosphohistidine phosphatase
LYVADIYDKIQEEVSAKGLDTECLGGGRIQHDAQNKKIHVYGYSQVGNF